jgi:hypothetical protein
MEVVLKAGNIGKPDIGRCRADCAVQGYGAEISPGSLREKILNTWDLPA